MFPALSSSPLSTSETHTSAILSDQPDLVLGAVAVLAKHGRPGDHRYESVTAPKGLARRCGHSLTAPHQSEIKKATDSPEPQITHQNF